MAKCLLKYQWVKLQKLYAWRQRSAGILAPIFACSPKGIVAKNVFKWKCGTAQSIHRRDIRKESFLLEHHTSMCKQHTASCKKSMSTHQLVKINLHFTSP